MLTIALGAASAIVLIWIGYPLAMAIVAASTSRRRALVLGERKRVSVIIATVDAEEMIRGRVADVRAGDYPAKLLEVIIALDSASIVQAAALCDLEVGGRVVRGAPPGGKAATLNAGVEASTGDILVFSDTAQRFDASAISRLVGALGDPRLGAVSGALHIGRDGRAANLAERYWRFERWLRGVEARTHSPVGVTGAVYAMRRECWRPLPVGMILDDLYVPMQLILRGYRVGFEARAEAYDDRRFAPRQEFRRKVRTLTGVIQLCAWLPDVLLPWRNPIWVQFIFHKVLRLATPYLLVLLAGSVVAWLVQIPEALSHPWARVVLAGLALGTLLLVANRRVRGALTMAVAMQVAVMRATMNGIRGRWDVWSR